MSERTRGRTADRLAARLDVLREIEGRAAGRLPDPVADRIDATLRQADARLGHGSAHTVVALAGATGSGKSSLFNALVGTDVAAVGVRRPTTSTAQGAVFGGGADALFDWLAVPRRHVVPASDLDGLVLLDLPDHDSVVAAHRDEVDRLVRVVDTFLWVVDPQKYADAALHKRYLSRFAAHGAVTIVVLNQIDTVPDPADRRAMVDDVGRLLAADGLSGVRTLVASARTEEGLDSLRRELQARVSERRALVARLDADVDWLVDDLRVSVGDVTPVPLDRSAERRLEETFGFASGVEALADAVGAAHRHRSVQHVGWPPLRWLRRLRPDPLRRLGLDRSVGTTVPGAGDAIPRSSRPELSTVSEAAIDEALRNVVTSAGEGLPDVWVDRVRDAATSRRADLADALDVAVTSSHLRTSAPRWWTGASVVQWAVTGVMAIGLAWLLLIGVVAWLRLPDLPTPEVRGAPLPTLLLLGGGAAGLVVAALARWAAGVGARRRASAARRELRERMAVAARTLVVEPVNEELARLELLQRLVRRLDT